MENLDNIIGRLHITDKDIIPHLLTKIYAIETANSAILANQAKILAHLQNRPLAEVLKEVQADYDHFLSQKQQEYTDWLSKFSQ